MGVARSTLTVAIALVAVAPACSPFGSAEAEPPDGGSSADASDASAEPRESGVPDAPASRTPCAAPALFCDDFEDRAGPTDLAGQRWEPAVENRALGVISEAVSTSASHSLEAAANVASSVALAHHFVAGPTVTVRSSIRLGAGTPFVYAQLVSFVLDGSFFAVIIDKDQLVAQFNDGSSTSYKPTGVKIQRDTWMRVAMQVRLGDKGSVVMSLDGARIYEAAAKTTASASSAQGSLRVGLTGGVEPFGTPKVWFDDIVVE